MRTGILLSLLVHALVLAGACWILVPGSAFSRPPPTVLMAHTDLPPTAEALPPPPDAPVPPEVIEEDFDLPPDLPEESEPEFPPLRDPPAELAAARWVPARIISLATGYRSPRPAPRMLAKPIARRRPPRPQPPPRTGPTRPPRPIPARCAPARYPSSALRAGIEGRVVLLLAISATGVVEKAEIFESSGHAALDRAALAAARAWHFMPALDRGRPVPRKVRVPVSFRLRG